MGAGDGKVWVDCGLWAVARLGIAQGGNCALGPGRGGRGGKVSLSPSLTVTGLRQQGLTTGN